AELLVLLGIFLAGLFGLLDYSLIVSLIVVEVPIGFVFWRLFERRRAMLGEALDILDLQGKHRHLRMHGFGVLPYPFTMTYWKVENVKKKQAFIAPKYLLDLDKLSIITKLKYDNEKAVLAFFEVNDIKFEKREPEPLELLT